MLTFPQPRGWAASSALPSAPAWTDILPVNCVQALTEHEQANQAFSTALSLWPNLADGWLSWGAHCDAMYQQSGNPTWLQYAVTCYLQVSRNETHTSVGAAQMT